MAKWLVNYRGEFEIIIEAETEEGAIELAQDKKNGWVLADACYIGLWPEFMSVERFEEEA